MENVIIYGNSAVANVTYYDLKDDSSYNVIAFTVDRGVITEENLCGLPVIPFDEIVTSFPPEDFKMIIAVGFINMNKLRADKYEQAKAKGYIFINLFFLGII